MAKKMPPGLAEYQHYRKWLAENGYSTNGKLDAVKRRALGHGAPKWSGRRKSRARGSRHRGGLDTVMPFYGTIPGW